ncbi:unnamed protein product [Diamesa hyperborea]
MMKLMIVVLVVAVCVVNAEEEHQKPVPVDSAAILETMLCAFTVKPMECARKHAGRMLNNWESIVEDKRRELSVEADQELEKATESRGLTEEEIKNEKPSEIIETIEKGLSTIATVMIDGVDTGRSSKSLKADGKSDDDEDDSNDFNDDDVSFFEESEGKNITVEARSDGDSDDGYYRKGSGGLRKGKKGKKHKKGIMKIVLIGAVMKAKLEMLLKVLSFHLQLKFFAVALVGLVINLARFWIELKKSHPQKVVYVEHAQHQHHYDEHDEGYGGHWKRSAQHEANAADRHSDYAQRLAYGNQNL